MLKHTRELKECDECHEVFDEEEMLELDGEWFCRPCDDRLTEEARFASQQMDHEYYSDRM